MSEEHDELPEGWKWVRVGEVCETTSGGTPSRQKAEYFGGKIPWVKSGELEDDVIRSAAETITESGLANSSAKIFPAGTPLVALYGATVGRTGLLGIDAATNQAVCALFPQGSVLDAHYLLRYLQSQRKDLIDASAGGAQPNISQKIVREWLLPLAPLPEQRRIVAKIERLFEQSRTAREALDGVPALLKRFRQSVLAAAFRGDLTERDPNDEPASVLLERIRAERREKFQGKKYVEPELPDMSDLPELPDGWCWTSFDEILVELKNGYFSGAPAYEPPGIPILRISAVRPRSVNLDSPRYLREAVDKVANYLLRDGDLLFTRYNGSLDLVGVCGMVRDLITPTVYPDKLIRARVFEGVLPEYLELYFATRVPRDIIEDKAKSSAGQQGISGKDLKSVPVAVASLAEQRRIVAQVESLFAQADAVEREVEVARRRAEKVDQAILARAFRGEL